MLTPDTHTHTRTRTRTRTRALPGQQRSTTQLRERAAWAEVGQDHGEAAQPGMEDQILEDVSQPLSNACFSGRGLKLE